MKTGTFPFFHYPENSLRASLRGCEIPVKSKPLGGPVRLCGKEALESLYRPARDKQGGEGKEERTAAPGGEITRDRATARPGNRLEDKRPGQEKGTDDIDIATAPHVVIPGRDRQRGKQDNGNGQEGIHKGEHRARVLGCQSGSIIPPYISP